MSDNDVILQEIERLLALCEKATPGPWEDHERAPTQFGVRWNMPFNDFKLAVGLRNRAPRLLRLLAEVIADKPDEDANGYLTFTVHKSALAAAVAAIKERK